MRFHTMLRALATFLRSLRDRVRPIHYFPIFSYFRFNVAIDIVSIV